MVLKDKVMGCEVKGAFEPLALSEADDITYLQELEFVERLYVEYLIYFGLSRNNIWVDPIDFIFFVG